MKRIIALVKKRKILWISVLCFLLAGPLLVMPVTSAIVYEAIFSTRYETAEWMKFSVEDFEGLLLERSDFEADRGVTLAGYCYSKADTAEPRGVVVISHGMGGGGHNQYLPFVDAFTTQGYAVFAYDARGNDNSGGKDIEGLPQGVIDLDYALKHVATLPAYQGLPVLLFGHSWGAYSAGNVLNFHPEVQAAVLIAGFNESRDMLLYQSEERVGVLARASIFYVTAYEKLKFGKAFTEISAVEGMKNSDARVMIVHSMDDETVPVEYGYDIYYEAFSDHERFEFVLYEDRGHSYLFYSDASREYKEALNADYLEYVKSHGGEFNAEIKTEFMNLYLDKARCFEPDPALMEKIFVMFEEAIAF